MFRAKLEAKTWKKIINAIASIIEEVSIDVTSEGIKFTAMDPSHISMVDFHMGKEHFEEYELTEETSLGLDIDENRKIINRSKPDDILTLEADETKITLTFQQRDGETVRRFGIPLIDVIGGEKYKVPHLDTTSMIRLPSYVFDDAIKDAYIISDNVTFIAQPALFRVKAEGDTGSIETEIREWVEYDVKEESTSTFNLSYLTDVAKSVENEITLNLGNDMPLKLAFTLDNAEILFILAPRVERE
ncbi:MAG: proliferating cell nuclear antigen (pcna) [Theionarchaea archaeon]|nr:proliferating cell nuclear antigen (pcna) [Theionarchaea archaeon]